MTMIDDVLMSAANAWQWATTSHPTRKSKCHLCVVPGPTLLTIAAHIQMEWSPVDRWRPICGVRNADKGWIPVDQDDPPAMCKRCVRLDQRMAREASFLLSESKNRAAR